jgi:ribosomal protein S18 acetylase RimI-like enzyme
MLVERQAGRAAEIWPPQLAAGEPHSTALALLAAVKRWLTEGGVQIVQALLHTDAQREAETLRASGFRHAADLLYLVCLDSEFPTQPPATPLRLEPCRPADHERLSRIVEATYVNTLDCPTLNGVRKVEDVLAGYRASGVFDPARWLIVCHGSDDVGCLILTAYPEHGTCELTYMGVVPAARGHAWGVDIARHAQWLTRQAGQPRLVLAVDAANGPALAAYAAIGFKAWDRRSVFLRGDGEN